MMPGKSGGHAIEAWRNGGTSVEGAYKAKVLKFQHSPEGIVSKVYVQHSYMFRQLELCPNGDTRGGNFNYLYPCLYKDWEDPPCILDVLHVVHAEIGEATWGNRSHNELLKNGMFFYNSIYHPKQQGQKYGKLEPIPLLGFDDPEWPLQDMMTSEAFWYQMHLE